RGRDACVEGRGGGGVARPEEPVLTVVWPAAGIVTLTEEQLKRGGQQPRLPDQASRGLGPTPDSFAPKRQHWPVNVTMPGDERRQLPGRHRLRDAAVPAAGEGGDGRSGQPHCRPIAPRRGTCKDTSRSGEGRV